MISLMNSLNTPHTSVQETIKGMQNNVSKISWYIMYMIDSLLFPLSIFPHLFQAINILIIPSSLYEGYRQIFVSFRFGVELISSTVLHISSLFLRFQFFTLSRMHHWSWMPLRYIFFSSFCIFFYYYYTRFTFSSVYCIFLNFSFVPTRLPSSYHSNSFNGFFFRASCVHVCRGYICGASSLVN